MGKTLEVLAKSKVPKDTIFSERFVVECCETFHFHIRNIRFEFTHEDFLKLRQALRDVDKTYSQQGEPKSLHHIELGRAELNPDNSPEELSIELCENIYRKYATGWDSCFHDEERFIHLHWRNLRIEMSNAEFLEFGKTVSQAYQKLFSYKFKTLSEIFDLLDREGIIYAVLRNWDHLPEEVEVGPHSDLDLLIHPDHVQRFDRLLDSRLTSELPYRVQRRIDILSPEGKPSYILMDVRQPGDGYYPSKLGFRMLNRRVRHKNFWVLHPEDHLVGLVYHVMFHKGHVGEGYPEKLKWLSGHVKKWPFFFHYRENDLTPYLINILTESKVTYQEPFDQTVRPILPLLYPYETLLSNRYLWFHEGRPIFSRVYLINTESRGFEIVKQTTFDFSRSEFDILNTLDSKYFPKVWEFESKDGHSSFREEYIKGTLLSEALPMISGWTFENVKDFIHQCIDMVKTLDQSGVQHRDLRAENVLVTKNGPVLLDFGWSISKERVFDEPEGADLGGEVRPPEGGPYDPFALGVVFYIYLKPFFPELKELINTLLISRAHHPVDWTRVDSLLSKLRETNYTSDVEKFIAYCERGRIPLAAEVLKTGIETHNETLRFWKAVVRLHEMMEEFPSDLPLPANVSNDTIILNRLLQNCLEKDLIQKSTEYIRNIVHAMTHPSVKTDLYTFLKLDEHFAIISSLIEPHLLRIIYEQGKKQEQWWNLRIRYLFEEGSDEEKSELLREWDHMDLELSPEAISYLAQLYFNEGDYERADSCASKVLARDPYWLECQKLMAQNSAKKNDHEKAIRFWRQYNILTESDGDSWQKMAVLEFEANKQEADGYSIPETQVKTSNPGEILQNIKQHLALDEPEMAFSYAKKLKEILPDEPEVDTIYTTIEPMVIEKHQYGNNRHLIIPPLTENTYRINVPIVIQQLEDLLKTGLGDHPIIRKKYADLTRQRQSRDGNGTFQNRVQSEKLVSIIMLTYNALEYTKKCIESIRKYTRFPYDIVFVDNASTDGTKKYLSKLVGKHPNYKLITNKENKGFAAGNNQGVDAANGDYILLLNNDVLVADGWLESMVMALEKDENIGMVGPLTNYISGRQMIMNVPYKDEKGFFEFSQQVRMKNDERITPHYRIAGFVVLMKKSLYLNINGLDESFGTGNYEDDDLCLKVREKGYAIMIDESTFIHHYGNQTFKANKIAYNQSLKEKGTKFKKKWPKVDYEELLELIYPLTDTHLKLLDQASGYVDQGNFDKAVVDFKQVYLENPLSQDALFGMAVCVFNLSDHKTAKKYLNKLLKLNPDHAGANNQLGIIAAESGDLNEAKTLFIKTIKIDMTFIDAHRNIGEILLEQGDYNNGVKTFAKILENHPDDIPTLLRMAQLYTEVGQDSEAVKYVEKVLITDPDNKPAQQYLNSFSI